MDPSPKDLTDQIDEATTLVLRTAETLTDDQILEPSLLSGWTRGHVLTHLARGSEVLAGYLDAARTGVPSDGYGAPGAREAGIEAGAGRGAAELIDDLRDAAGVWQAAVAAMPAAAWTNAVVIGGKQTSAREILIARLVEVELHHVDLGVDYVPAEWPTTFNELQLRDPQRQWRADRLV